MSGGGLTSDHATKTIDADQAWNRSARSEQRSSAAAPGGAGNQQTQRLARGSAGSTRGGPRQQPADSPLVDWVRKAAGAFMTPRPSGVTAPGDRYGSLDDPNFNAQYIADDLNRAIDSSEHTLMLTSDGFWAMKEDVSRERRKVDAGTVISRLENRTPLQLNEIRARYAAFGHRPADALDTDLLHGGESGRQADLTDDQVKRIKVLLRGTVAETRGGWLEEDAERNRLEAVAIELHELFADDLDDAKRERVMLLHRRPIADIDVIDSMYAKNYGYSALAYDIHRRLEGAQLFRLGLLRDGEIAKADAVAIEDKRRQIEELNKKDAELENQSFAVDALAFVSGVSPYQAILADKRHEQRERLTADIDAIIEQNKQEALKDTKNIGTQSGEAIAARLATILNQGNGEGQTLGSLLTATLSPRSAGAITAAVDPWDSGGDRLVETAAAQLRDMVRNGKATGRAIESMLQSLQKSAMHDLQAKVLDPKVPLKEKQAIDKDIPAAINQLAQHYADGLVAAYDRMIGPSEPKFAQIVSGLKDADATHLEFARTHAGATSDLADLQHAMDTEDVEGVKAVLRRQHSGEAVQKLVADYDRIGIGRNLVRELFGRMGDTDVTPELAAKFENTRFTRGMVAGRDAVQIAELLPKKPGPTSSPGRPVEGPSGDSAAAEVAWMTAGASGEYDVTMEHRGVLRHIGELTHDPETKQLMAATRDRVNELKTQWERTADPQERQHLFSEIRKARAALTGDADAYEKETEQIVAEFRSAVSFAVSIALAVALPGVGAGLSFLEATALNIGANIAANIVIKGDTYSVSDLEGDLLGGIAGAAGGKLGEELLGKVAQKIAGPVAKETGIVAERVGIRTELTEAAAAMTRQGEQIVIDTAEVEAKLAGTAAKAADSTFVSVAKEMGNILGGTAATKVISGDASLSGADVVQTVAGIFGGKLAARRVAAKAARSMVRGGESAPASKVAGQNVAEPAPVTLSSEVQASAVSPATPPTEVAEKSVTGSVAPTSEALPTTSVASTPTELAPPSGTLTPPPDVVQNSPPPSAPGGAGPQPPGPPGGSGQNVLVVGAETPHEFAYAADLAAAGQPVTVVNPVRTEHADNFAAQGGNFIEGRIEHLPDRPAYTMIREDFPFPLGRAYPPTTEFAAARLRRLVADGRWVVVTEAPEFATTLRAAAESQGARVMVREIPAAHEGAPVSIYPRERQRFALIIEKPASAGAVKPGESVQPAAASPPVDTAHVKEAPERQFGPAGPGSGGGAAPEGAPPVHEPAPDIELGHAGPGQGGNPPNPPGPPGTPDIPGTPESAPDFELGPAGSTVRPFKPDVEVWGSSFVRDLITRKNEGEAQVGDIARYQHQGSIPQSPTSTGELRYTLEKEHVTPANELSHRSFDPLIGAPDIEGRVGGNDTPDVANEYTIIEHERVSDRKTSLDAAARRAMLAAGGPTDFVEDLLLDPLARHQQASLDAITAGEISPLEATDPIHRALVAQAQVWERGQASGGMALARSRAAATGQPIKNLRNPARMRAAEIARRQARLAIEPGGIAGPEDYNWDATFDGAER